MTLHDNTFNQHQLERWTRPDAHHFVRADWRQSVSPTSNLAAIFGLYERKYREDQLRDHGRFAYEGRDKRPRVRLAASELIPFGPKLPAPLGPKSKLVAAFEAALSAIETYRTVNHLRDLFGRDIGTLSYTELNGKGIYGVNSTAATYEASDRAAADQMRDILIKDFPDYFDKENIGQAPNNAIYHAEATALFRAARENGGTLKGQELVVHVDTPMCKNCQSVLPYIGLELDNPTVTFVGPRGEAKTMRDGHWVKVK